MRIIELNINNIEEFKEEIVLCLGYFDGVHIGHQKLINEALNEGYKVGVLTFDRPVYSVINKNIKFTSITSVTDRFEIFDKLGVSYLFVLHFDEEVLNKTKDEFINFVLKKLSPKKIYCGSDYSFGFKGEGNPEYLSNYFDVNIVSLELIDNKKIGSKSIREYIETGEIDKANEMLGRAYRISGLVVHGKHNGSTINFPTANLDLDYSYILPKVGVYIGYAYVDNVKMKSIINVGTHPTIMKLRKPIVEVHILDYSKDIYDKSIYVEFVSFIREEKPFNSMDELKNQLEFDKNFAKIHLQ